MPTHRPTPDTPESGRQLRPGDSVERYVVESVIGSGGTANVYKVHHADLGNSYALKVLSIVSPAIRRRTLQEGKVQAQMHHRNIVAVYDVFEVDGAPALLMEYVEGPSLEVALQRHRFTLDQARILFRGVLDGVRHAHRLGLVHRDLKPANVLLAQTSRGVVPKVTDFGIAKITDAEMSQTRAGVAMGTPQYMAPEQIRDARTVDQRADVFSLGCMLYELVCGRRAFPYEDIVKVYNAVCDGEYTPPRRLVPDLPDALDAAILGALEVDRDRRIPDCDTLAAVFEGLVQWNGEQLPEAMVQVEDTEALLAADAVAHTFLPPDLLHQDGPDDLTTSEMQIDGTPLTLSPPSRPEAAVEVTRQRAVWPIGVLGVLLGIGGGFFALQAWRSAQVEPLTPVAEASVDAAVEPPPAALVAPGAPEASAKLAPTEPHAAPIAAAPAAQTAPANPPPAAAIAGSTTPAPHAAAPAIDPAAGTGAPADEPQIPAAAPVTDPATEPAPAPTPEPAPAAAPAAPVSPTVRILSTPPTASVWVDGDAVGRTPLKLTLAPGRHQVRIQSAEDTQYFPIQVHADADNRWCYVFSAHNAVAGACPP